MKINEIITEVMQNTYNAEGKKIKQVEIVEQIFEKFNVKVSPAALSDRLKNENMQINTVIEILDILGYEVAIRPKKGSRETYIVERGEKRR